MTIEQFEEALKIMQVANGCESISSELKALIVNNMFYKGAMAKYNFKLKALEESLIKTIDKHFSELHKETLEQLRRI